jgi:predicted xylose isomerase-like sugar epimerase
MTARKPIPRPREPLDAATLRALEDVIAAEGVTGTAERLGVSRSTLRRIRQGGPLWATTAARVAKEVWK